MRERERRATETKTETETHTERERERESEGERERERERGRHRLSPILQHVPFGFVLLAIVTFVAVFSFPLPFIAVHSLLHVFVLVLSFGQVQARQQARRDLVSRFVPAFLLLAHHTCCISELPGLWMLAVVVWSAIS